MDGSRTSGASAAELAQAAQGGPADQARPMSAGELNALVHLYRAEVGRMTSYRQRLDTTTNWSVTSSALVTTFAVGNATISHAAFLFLMFLNVFFLVVEARRFRVYEAARYRVLVMERYFYPEVMGEATARGWRPALIESLRTPYSYPQVEFLGAMGWRLRRNYLWIYAAVLLVWLTKLELTRPANLLAAAAVGEVPGVVIWGVVAVFYVALVSIGVLAKRRYPMGSETAQAVLSQEPD